MPPNRGSDFLCGVRGNRSAPVAMAAPSEHTTKPLNCTLRWLISCYVNIILEEGRKSCGPPAGSTRPTPARLLLRRPAEGRPPAAWAPVSVPVLRPLGAPTRRAGLCGFLRVCARHQDAHWAPGAPGSVPRLQAGKLFCTVVGDVRSPPVTASQEPGVFPARLSDFLRRRKRRRSDEKRPPENETGLIYMNGLESIVICGRASRPGFPATPQADAVLRSPRSERPASPGSRLPASHPARRYPPLPAGHQQAPGRFAGAFGRDPRAPPGDKGPLGRRPRADTSPEKQDPRGPPPSRPSAARARRRAAGGSEGRGNGAARSARKGQAGPRRAPRLPGSSPDARKSRQLGGPLAGRSPHLSRGQWRPLPRRRPGRAPRAAGGCSP